MPISYGFSMVVIGVKGWWEAEEEAERPVEGGHRGQEIGGRGQGPDGRDEPFPDKQTQLGRRGKAAPGRASGKWSLGAVKKVDLTSLWEDDLYGSQSLDQTHRALTTSALPERRLADRSGGRGWGFLSEEQTAVWKQVVASSVGEPAKVANPWEALRQYVLGKAEQKLLTGKSQGTRLVV
jgi:hypothetical protein